MARGLTTGGRNGAGKVVIETWLGAIAILVLLAASQEWFLEHHRRRCGMWRSLRERHYWADPEERSRMWLAVTHRDPDPAVERARLVALAGIAFCVVAGLILFAREAAS